MIGLFFPIPSLGMAWSNAAVAGCVGGIARSVEEDFGVAGVAAVELGAADEEARSLSAAAEEEEGGRERRRA